MGKSAPGQALLESLSSAFVLTIVVLSLRSAEYGLELCIEGLKQLATLTISRCISMLPFVS